MNIAIIINWQKLDSLDYILFANIVGLASINLTQSALTCNTVSTMTQNNGHYAVQGHSRSPILGHYRRISVVFRNQRRDDGPVRNHSLSSVVS